LNAIQARSQLRHSPDFSVFLRPKSTNVNRFAHCFILNFPVPARLPLRLPSL
jgi:hypothetical protein